MDLADGATVRDRRYDELLDGVARGGSGGVAVAGVRVFVAVLLVKVGLHDDEGHLALGVDEVHDAFDAGFLDLAGFTLEEDGELFHALMSLGAETVAFGRAALGEKSEGVADEIGDGFSAIPLVAHPFEHVAFFRGHAHPELAAFTVVDVFHDPILISEGA